MALKPCAGGMHALGRLVNMFVGLGLKIGMVVVGVAMGANV